MGILCFMILPVQWQRNSVDDSLTEPTGEGTHEGRPYGASFPSESEVERHVYA